MLANSTVKSITVGTTTTLDPGNSANVSNSGTAQDLVLDFEIPRGYDGITPTFKVNSTTTLPSGEPANVIMTEVNPNEYAFDFYIPKDENGSSGDTMLYAGMINGVVPDKGETTTKVLSGGNIPLKEIVTVYNDAISLVPGGFKIKHKGVYKVDLSINCKNDKVSDPEIPNAESKNVAIALIDTSVNKNVLSINHIGKSASEYEMVSGTAIFTNYADDTVYNLYNNLKDDSIVMEAVPQEDIINLSNVGSTALSMTVTHIGDIPVMPSVQKTRSLKTSK